MDSAAIKAVLSKNVKFFLDKGVERRYSRRFNSKDPTPWVCNESALSPVL